MIRLERVASTYFAVDPEHAPHYGLLEAELALD
jgi:hypothetical protein